MKQLGITITTTNDKEQAKLISKKMLELKLGACCQLEEIESMYIWNDEMITDQEFKISIKHPTENSDSIRAELLSIHKYDTPEIITYNVDVNEKYLKWCYDVCILK